MNLGYEPQGLKIYLFGESVDMRKQMNGLIALVEGTYHMDPFEKALFLFTNKKKDKIKALKWTTSSRENSVTGSFTARTRRRHFVRSFWTEGFHAATMLQKGASSPL